MFFRSLRLLWNTLTFFPLFLVNDLTKRYWNHEKKIQFTVESKHKWYYEIINSPKDYLLFLNIKEEDEEDEESTLFVDAFIKQDGKNYGIVGVGININSLIENFKELSTEKGTLLFLLNEKNEILISSSLQFSLGQHIDEYFSDMSQREEEEIYYETLEEGRYALSKERIEGTEFSILIAYPEESLTSFFNSIQSTNLITMIVTILVSSLVLYFVVSGVTSNITRVNDQLKQLAGAEADLTFSVDIHSRDEIGVLTESVNVFVSKLKHIIKQVQRAVSSTDSDLFSVASSTTESTAALNQINNNITSVTSSVSSLNQNLDDSRQNVKSVQSASRELMKQIDLEVNAIGETSAAAEEINAQADNIRKTAETQLMQAQGLSAKVLQNREDMGTVQEKILNLSQGADSMMEVIAVITGISQQTNLLSMNAAIEAAHAGEQGKGFAVVADEIRKLAESSSENSRLINESLQVSVSQIVEVSNSFDTTIHAFTEVEASTKSVVEGFGFIKDTVDELSLGIKDMTNSFLAIKDAIKIIDNKSREITDSSEDLVEKNEKNTEAGTKVSDAMSRISSGSQEINASFHSLTDAIQKISDQMADIRVQVEHFRTDNTTG